MLTPRNHTPQSADTTTARHSNSCPIDLVDSSTYTTWLSDQETGHQSWLTTTRFGQDHPIALLPDHDGHLAKVAVFVGENDPGWQMGAACQRCPEGYYHLAHVPKTYQSDIPYLAWALGGYRFDRYRHSQHPAQPTLLIDDATQHARLAPLVDATKLVRDMINTPAEDMGPADIGDLMKNLANQHSGHYRAITDKKLAEEFPAVQAVGRASHRAPMLHELSWGDTAHPTVALVGKGVCYDTGGLNLKPTSGMALMKKDMGGAAHAIALASLVMHHQLPVRLVCVVPAVDNAIAGNAYRPGDVIATRQGLSVEIGNTDAEGRLILADALTYVDEQEPDLIIDFATLTGAARVALGTDLPALFSTDLTTSHYLQALGDNIDDPLWPMPLHQPYDRLLKSNVADLNNAPKGPGGGAITAALFLKRFVRHTPLWLHIDQMAYNSNAKPGRPEGGEAQGLRAIFSWLQQTYQTSV